MSPWLEIAGQIAAIVICLFAAVFILLAVAFNLAVALGMSWLGEKINAIKMLRPTVESVNKATESALQGVSPDENQNSIVRTVAFIPTTMHNVEKKVDQSTEKVADAVIEFRARTVQAKTILKAFFLPGLMHKKLVQPADDQARLEIDSPSSRMLATERPTTIPIESPPDNSTIPLAEQAQHAAIH